MNWSQRHVDLGLGFWSNELKIGCIEVDRYNQTVPEEKQIQAKKKSSNKNIRKNMDKNDKTNQKSKGKPGKPHCFCFLKTRIEEAPIFFFYHGSQKMLEFGRVGGLEISWFGTHFLLTRGLKRCTSTTILWGPFHQPSPVSGFWVQDIHS